ncbi:MAG: xylulokinase [Lachnospiraceae bacterium]|nr:xylulokinase [Lachnospiraceae bacterium]
MKYLIGIDCGTSAVKTILINENGEILSQASKSYPLYEPDNGWAEQDPADWADAALDTLSKVVKEAGVRKEDVAGIGLSGQMHGLVMLDEEGTVIRRSIIWCDQRSEKQVSEMLEMMPYERWLEITANPPVAAWTAAKYLWVRENEPQLIEKCRHILLPKDYIRYVLTGEFATDVSDASGMQMMDVKNRCWSKEVLDKLGIEPEKLGKLYESREITGYLRPEIAEKCGLTTKTAVVGGGADNPVAAIGMGCVADGDAFTSLGTSGLVYTHLDQYRPIPDGGLHLCCSCVPGTWFSMGGPQAASLSVEWFKNNFCKGLIREAEESGRNVYDLLLEKVRSVKPGSERLIYMPYLMGERTPHLDPKMRGAFVGLNTIHKEEHLLRAIYEGITYLLADCNNILKDLGVNVRHMRVCGGGSKSPVWQQIMADLYDCEIITMEKEEGPALGAAILAGSGTGVFPDLRAASKQFARTGATISPNPENVAVYKKYHALFDQLYDHMKGDFSVLYDL